MFKKTSILWLAAFLASCQTTEKSEPTILSWTPFIPKPLEIKDDSSYHLIGALETVNIVLNDALLDSWNDKVNPDRKSPISFHIEHEMANESYELSVTEESITIKSSDQAGRYNALITLQQILGLNAVEYPEGWAIPTGKIIDRPRFAYRGMMLDISRHFFSKDEILQIIDHITLFKINHLHLHMADDQGWRIEIKSWPKLTEIGGSTEVDGGPGGFLTQEDFKEIVQYAAKRNISVVPEIDMPGHTNAALASYAELNCDGEARELYTGIEVGFSSFCTDKELTYEFISDVVAEIAAISPGRYFHIGGDESHSTQKEDYRYFINRVYEIVKSNGKTMIGWDEIGDTQIGDQTIVQLWHHPELAQMGLDKGAGLLFSLAKHCYLDMKYDSTTTLGLKWAGYIDLPKAYNWDPTDFIDSRYQNKFLGVESPLWSETVTNVKEAEYLIFPRLAAHAEIGWTSQNRREFEDFESRIKKQADWWRKLGMNFGD